MTNSSRALKLHHAKRIKNNRKHYWGGTGKGLRKLGILLNTPKPCSCMMCRNKRSYEGKTLQELRAISGFSLDW
jgi:hypothetical protein